MLRSNTTHNSAIIASHLNHPFSALSKKIHTPHCSHTTHNPVTTASRDTSILFFFFFCIQSKKTEVHPDSKTFRSQSLRKRKKGGIPETRRALVKVRTHPAHAPGFFPSLVLSQLDTASHQYQIQPRRCLSDTTTHHHTLGPCVPQKHHLGGVMVSNRGSLRVGVEGVGEGRHHSWLGPGGEQWLGWGWQPLGTSMRCCLCMCAS